ncbi:MAG: hypothetical protein F2934_02350 [Actinobacteria bacterium]|uniref:Unannotated protein n=1 Tax=freshwater metagenome TaxID=449393 RepID=A0A6J6NY35_9ZZZZ|nr:hypothetical protein [Actinomycetota bacterium]MSY11512.1 hypothetical protein [Actinomycetota bacterium]MSZ03837.1 hypothetical protein [Actinomycetota bacterium]MTB05955.1 hypothetical protein [Actinomycetota bacterium]
MSAAAAQRLERRSDIAPRRANTSAHTRPETRPQTQRGASPAIRQPQLRRRVVHLAAPSTLERRATSRPLPADLAALSQVQVFRPRAESGAVARSEQRQASRTNLRSVPQRRRIASILAPALVVVFLAMLGVTTFQTRMAEEQVKLDQLQVKVDKARELHQSLERERAELRSPVHLGREAATMKMSAADAVGFVTVDAQTYTEVLAASAAMPLDESGARP